MVSTAPVREVPLTSEWELYIIGSVIAQPTLIDELTYLKPLHFSNFDYASIYDSVIEMHSKNKKIDGPLVFNYHKKKHKSALDSELISTIGDACVQTPVYAHCHEYAERIIEDHGRRELITACQEIMHLVRDSHDTASAIQAKAEQLIMGVGDKSISVKDPAVPINEVMHQIMEQLQKPTQKALIKTGFHDLDKLVNLKAGQLIILAARTSMGKSALAGSILLHASLTSQCMFFSLEMDHIEMGERMVSLESRVPIGDIREFAKLSRESQLKVHEALGAVASREGNLMVDHTPGRSVSEIASYARRHKRKHGLSLIVVDYIQLVTPGNEKDPRQEQVAKTSRQLKLLARELNCVVLCLAQVNRKSEDSKDKIPQLSHLRESGAIEQDADVVIFIHRDEYYETDEAAKARVAGQADIIIAKQRGGDQGRIKLRFIKNLTRFENPAPEHHERKERPRFPDAHDFGEYSET
jgi:replicative DNA helicase